MKSGEISGVNVKMCRIIVASCFLLSGFLSVLKADPVDAEQAKAVALTQFRMIAGEKVGLRSASTLNVAYEAKLDDGKTAFYVINSNDGFVIVSGDDRVTPVLAYSTGSSYEPENIPPAMQFFLDEYINEIDYVISNDIKPSDGKLKKQWHELKSGETATISLMNKAIPSDSSPVLRSGSDYIPGTYLLETKWGQRYAYNTLCPYFTDGQRCATGCIATAMSQILRYWEYPQNGFNSHSYYHSNANITAGTLSADFRNTTYQYENMPLSVGTGSPQHEIDAVSLLMYHTGISVNMNYGVESFGSSSASMYSAYHNEQSAYDAFRDFWGYRDVKYADKYYFTYAEWLAIIKSQIDKKYPVLYSVLNSSTGHVFICDGYDEENRLHINWGWDGSGDTFFLLSAMDPGYGSNYTSYISQSLLVDIYPTASDFEMPERFNNKSLVTDVPSYMKNILLNSIINPIDSGQVNNIFWNIQDSVLTISGIGAIKNYTDHDLTYNPPPWLAYGSFIKKIVIQEGITSIGDRAFKHNRLLNTFNTTYKNLDSVEISASVTSIGDEVFFQCSLLVSINMSERIIRIGNRTFEGCSKLQHIELPNSITSIGEFAFRYCNRFTDANIPNSMTTIGRYAFGVCLGLESINIPDNVIFIEQYAFIDCPLKIVNVYWEQPLQINSDVFISSFEQMPVTGATLVVPPGTKAAYENADVWKDFGTIIERMPVIYVTPDGCGSMDGSSWANATPHLHEVVKADYDRPTQIWVKEGIYYGDTLVKVENLHSAAFIISRRSQVYGSFSGIERSLKERRLRKGERSVLDGQNSRRVLYQVENFAETDSAVWDGFTIQNGKSISWGGGVVLKSNGTLRNCDVLHCKIINHLTERLNYNSGSGGGIYNCLGGKVINCSLLYNELETTFSSGGGIMNYGYLYVDDPEVVISGNSVLPKTGDVLYPQCYGGAIYNVEGEILINNCEISNNKAVRGGAIFGNRNITLNNCNVSDNFAEVSGAGIDIGIQTKLYMNRVKMQRNRISDPDNGVSAINNSGGEVYLKGCLIGGETDKAPESIEEALSVGGNIGKTCIISSSYTQNYPGIFRFCDDDTAKNIVSGNYGVGLTLEYGGSDEYSIPKNVFICANYGGGLVLEGGSRPYYVLDGCTISGNVGDISWFAYSNGRELFSVGGVLSRARLKIKGNTVINDNIPGGVYNGYSLLMENGLISNNRNFGIYSFELMTLTGGEILNNKYGIYNGSYNYIATSLSDSIKISDTIFIKDMYKGKVDVGPLIYHSKDNPIFIDAEKDGTYALNFETVELLSDYINNEVFRTASPKKCLTVDLRYGNHVYLRENVIKSSKFYSGITTENMDIISGDISAYPTLIRSGGKLTIESPDGGMASVWSLSGVLIGQYKLYEGKTQIPAPNASGTYVVKIKTDMDKEKIIKIIVK